jgi:hypothetical protein
MHSSTLFLTSALEGGERSASRSGRTLSRERTGTHYTGGWEGLRAGLGRCGKSRPHWDSIPGPSSPQAVAIPTTLPGPLQRLLPLLKLGIRSKGGRVCISHFSVKHEKVHPVVKVQQYGFGHFTHLTTSHHLKANKTMGLKHMPIRALFLKFNFQIVLKCIPL